MSESSIKKESFEVTAPNSWMPWLVASIAALVILGIAIGLMALLGLFMTPQNDSGVKSLAAALGLIGAVLSAVLTLVGTIIKYSIDDRNERQAALDASRNYALALEAEKRNRIEAAIRAVDLLGENNKDTTNNQMGGALLALVSLDELDLAVSLLAQLWPTGNLSPHFARRILAAALKSSSEQTQTEAGIVLYKNASSIQQDGFHIWPDVTMSWRIDLFENCRLGLVCAAAEWLKAEIRMHRQGLPNATIILYGALEDPVDIIVDVAAACLRPLVNMLPEETWVYTPGGPPLVTVRQISERLNKLGSTAFTNFGEKYQADITDLYEAMAASVIQTAVK